jgi:predicted dehydrogenase
MPLNLALLGSGLFATNAYLPSISEPSNKHIKLHTLWSRSESSVSKLASKATELGHSPRVLHGPEGLQAIWDDKSIEAVSLVLPITAQPELILAALKAGKHVISEKPVGKDVQAARELIEEYERVYKPKGLIWRVAESGFRDDQVVRG